VNAAVVIVNAVIGFIQDGRVELAVAAIRTMIDSRASNVGEGRRVIVTAEDTVPGDFVILEAGDRSRRLADQPRSLNQRPAEIHSCIPSLLRMHSRAFRGPCRDVKDEVPSLPDNRPSSGHFRFSLFSSSPWQINPRRRETPQL
jgi:hypothetical protein